MDAFKQLLFILPPQSKHLVPSTFHSIMETFPTESKVDLAGKKFEWQGVVLIEKKPDFSQEYLKLSSQVPEKEIRRNKPGRIFLYKFNSSSSYEYKSYYGTLMCSTKVTVLN
jgi:5'-3' exonuclease